MGGHGSGASSEGSSGSGGARFGLLPGAYRLRVLRREESIVCVCEREREREREKEWSCGDLIRWDGCVKENEDEGWKWFVDRLRGFVKPCK